MKRLEEVDDLHQLISSKDSFFYDLGYSPESRCVGTGRVDCYEK